MGAGTGGQTIGFVVINRVAMLSQKMLRRVLITLPAVAVLAGFTALFVERVDDGFIVVTRSGVIDPVGETKLAFTRLTRNCQRVHVVDPASLRLAIASSDLNSQVAARRPEPRAGWTESGWILAETEFGNLEPAILLLEPLEPTGAGFHVAAVYSGTAAPFNDTQFIHGYLSQQRADAPRQLIRCYEPVGAPFNRSS